MVGRSHSSGAGVTDKHNEVRANSVRGRQKTRGHSGFRLNVQRNLSVGRLCDSSGCRLRRFAPATCLQLTVDRVSPDSCNRAGGTGLEYLIYWKGAPATSGETTEQCEPRWAIELQTPQDLRL